MKKAVYILVCVLLSLGIILIVEYIIAYETGTDTCTYQQQKRLMEMQDTIDSLQAVIDSL